MTLSRPFGTHDGYPNAVDFRRAIAGLAPRQGVFPDSVTTGSGIAYPGTGWNVGARPFVAASKRGGAIGSLSYGAALFANDGDMPSAWTVPPSPAAGSRIDILWARARDFLEGDSGTDAPTDGAGGSPRAIAEYGVTTGQPATSPVASSLPPGAVEIARVNMPSTAVSIAGATITQTAAFVVPAGGATPVRNAAELAQYAPHNSARAVRLDNGVEYQRIAGSWIAISAPRTAPGSVSVSFPLAMNAGTQGLYTRDGFLLGTVMGTKKSGALVHADVLFVLPLGARPETEQSATVVLGPSPVASYLVSVAPDGEVKLLSPPGGRSTFNVHFAMPIPIG